VGVSATLIIVFLFATAPVAAHVMARAAYRVSVPLWKRSVRDELRPLYDGKPPA
jgi:multicomponent Na+:H+ antiporter subunit G